MINADGDQTFQVVYVTYVSAERCLDADNDPLVVLSFDYGEDGLRDIAICRDDAWALIRDSLIALSEHGDTRAEQILDSHFPG